MIERDQNLKMIRPKVSVEPNSKITETFQNETLRPILKLQNNLIFILFRNLIKARKNTYQKMDTADKILFIEKSLKEDKRFKDLFLGIIIGHFTAEESHFYFENVQELSKRIITMMIQRIQSQLETI